MYLIDLMTEDLSLDEIAEMPLEKFAELIQKKDVVVLKTLKN